MFFYGKSIFIYKKYDHICQLFETNYTFTMSDSTSQLDVWNKFTIDGDLDALSQIYSQYYDLLFDYGHRHISDKQLVEDAIQDIFINFIRLRKNIGLVKNLNGYIISVFRRRLFLDFNKRKRTILIEKFPEEHFDYFRSQEHNNSDNENKEQLYSTVKNCIGKLTDSQREIIYLRFEREISYEEIALTLNISVDSCYKSTYRSIKIIRSEVENILNKKGNIFLLFLNRFVH